MCDKEEMSLLLSRLVDGDLTPQERGEVLRHVAECPDCAQDLEDLRLLHQFYLTPPPPPAALKRQVLQAAKEERPPRRRRLLRRAVPLAAAACLALTCALTLRFSPLGQGSAGDGASPADVRAQADSAYSGGSSEPENETAKLEEKAEDAAAGDGTALMDGAAEYSAEGQAPLATGTPEYSLYVLLPTYSETEELSAQESVITYSDAEELWPGDLTNPADAYVKVVLPEQQLNTYVAANSGDFEEEDVEVITVAENASGYGVLLMPAQ